MENLINGIIGVSPFASCTINDNKMTCEDDGINVSLMDLCAEADISDNTVILDIPIGSPYGFGTGIDLSASLNTTMELLVELNTIHVYKGIEGIVVENIGVLQPQAEPRDTLMMLNNYVYMHENTKYVTGFRLDNCPEFNLYCNGSYGMNPGPPLNLHTSFSIIRCEDANILCNKANHSRIGFEFSGNCLLTNFAESEMNFHDIGLLYNGSAVMSQQNFTGNVWLQQCFTSDATCNANPFLMQYLVNSPPFIYLPTFNVTPSWFQNVIGTNANNCPNGQGSPCPQQIPNNDEEEISENELRIAQGLPVSVDHEEGILELAKATLFQHINDSVIEIDTSIVLQNFYSLNHNSRYNNLADANHIRVALSEEIGDILLDYKPYIEQIQFLLESKRLLLMSYGTSSTLSNAQTTLIRALGIYNSMKQHAISMQGTYLTKKPILETIHSNWANRIISITDNTLMTLNLQQLIPIIDKVVLGNSNPISQSELDLVTILANSCPYTDGLAVNHAQGILKAIDHTFVADNKYNCALNGINYKLSITANEYLQPSSLVLINDFIILPIEVIQDCNRVNIYDMKGNLISTSGNVKNQINTASWPNGIYIVQIIRGCGKTHSYKLNITK